MFWLDRFATDACRRVIAMRALVFMLGCCLMLGQLLVSEAKAGTTTPVLAAGYAHSLALKSDGTLWAWGQRLRPTGDGSGRRVLFNSRRFRC
jgi:hypothetical protein